MSLKIDSYIKEIINNTKNNSNKPTGATPLSEHNLHQKSLVITDDDLDQMIPNNQKNILINAHLPEFDDFACPHRHTFYEMIYVHQGTVKMSLSHKTFLFSTGDFILLNPDITHKVTLGSSNTQSINILLKRSLFDNVFMLVLLDNPAMAHFFSSLNLKRNSANYMIYRQVAQYGSDIQNYLYNILKEYVNNEQLCTSALKINLAGLLIELSRCYPASPSSKVAERDFCLANICSYIIAHIQQATLEETALYFHYNPKYFSMMLKKSYGKPFSNLLQDLRVYYAASLIEKTDLSINKICYAVGYENTNYFYRLFENIYGVKPGDYRKNLKSREQPC